MDGMKLNIVDVIKELQKIAVEEGNLELMIVTEIDGHVVAQRGFMLATIEYDSDGRTTKICALVRDDLEDIAEIGLEVDTEAMEKRRKKEGMN